MISARNEGRAYARWVAGLGLLVAIASSGGESQAQVQRAFYQPNPAQPGGAVRNANFNQGNSGGWMNAYGDPVVVPAGYCGPGGSGAGMGGGPGMGGGGGCNICGGGGCPCCSAAAGTGPYPPGGPFGNCGPGGGFSDPSMDAYGSPNMGVDQSGPHYFDFSAEALYWQRADTGEPRVDFTTIGAQQPPLGRGDAALSTDSLSFDEETGMRLVGRYDLGALTLIEVGYSGLFEWSDAAQVNGDAQNPLFSLFSKFGTDPLFGAGLTDSDVNAISHRIEYRSELHNGEISFRRYWIGNSPRVTGTLLAGVRYTRLTEDFFFDTVTQTGNMNYFVSTTNDLVGIQTGGDIWVTARQGLRLGAEGKIGLYNNRAKQRTRINTSRFPERLEGVKNDHAAFIAEGSLSVVGDILPSLSVRAGYDVLFINTVALAPNNFNASTAGILDQPRVPVLIEESSVLYHGFNAGFEYVW